MIEIHNVTKRFYTLTALDDVSLTIPRGEVLGLLGPNGAGKTTLMKVIAGLIKADAGYLRSRNGRWPAIGYKPERLLYPNQLRVDQYLKMVAQLSDIPDERITDTVAESLVQVNMLEFASKRIKDCSKGMRQRLGLAQVLIGNPPLLLLDEPSNGLDPMGQADVLRYVRQLHAAGRTVVMSSHQLQEVTQVCTQLVILNEGRVLYRNSMAEALAARAHTFIRVDRDLQGMRQLLQNLHPDIHVNGDRLVLENEAMALRRQVLSILLNSNFDILHVEQKRNTLTQIYAEAVQ